MPRSPARLPTRCAPETSYSDPSCPSSSLAKSLLHGNRTEPQTPDTGHSGTQATHTITSFTARPFGLETETSRRTPLCVGRRTQTGRQPPEDCQSQLSCGSRARPKLFRTPGSSADGQAGRSPGDFRSSRVFSHAVYHDVRFPARRYHAIVCSGGSRCRNSTLIRPGKYGLRRSALVYASLTPNPFPR